MNNKQRSKKLEAALIQIYEDIKANHTDDESLDMIKKGIKIIPSKPHENLRLRAFTDPAHKDRASIMNFTAEELTYLALKEKQNNIPYADRIYTTLIVNIAKFLVSGQTKTEWLSAGEVSIPNGFNKINIGEESISDNQPFKYEKLTLRLGNGKIRNIIIDEGLNTGNRMLLEQSSGLNFDDGVFLVQLRNMMNICLEKYSNNKAKIIEIAVAGLLISAEEFAKINNGRLAFFEDTKEPVVYVPGPDGHFIYKVDQKILSEDGEEVTLMTEPSTFTDKLTEQMNEAIESEDYDRAAKLRDEIAKRDLSS